MMLLCCYIDNWYILNYQYILKSWKVYIYLIKTTVIALKNISSFTETYWIYKIVYI